MCELEFIKPNWPAPANVKTLQTTRVGGVNQAPYASFNLGGHVGDDVIAVAENRQRLRTYLPSEPVWVNQVHGIEVIDAAKNTGFNNAGFKNTVLQNADASFTTEANVVCVTMTADCLPVLLCDKDGTVVSSVHAGWRGLCDGVIEAAVKKMAVPPVEILAWLGPAIGPNTFEVGDDVRQQFLLQDSQAELAFKPHPEHQSNAKWLCNMYLIAQQRLNKIGVTQIYGGGINENFCTYNDEARFFSYRRDNVTGRMASMIWLVP